MTEDDLADNKYEDVDLNDQEYEEITASKWSIPWKDLDLSGKILGKGNFGEVQFGRVCVKGKWIKAAVKTLKGKTYRVISGGSRKEYVITSHSAKASSTMYQ